MKKICLLLALAATGFTAYGQKALNAAGNARSKYAIDPSARPEVRRADSPMESEKSVPSGPRTVSSIVGSDWADQVGYTYFDLQSYGSNSTGLQYYPSTGNISVIWQYGRGVARGSRMAGYNHYSGSLNRWLFTAGITTPGTQDDSVNFMLSPLRPVSNSSPQTGLASFANGRIGWPNLIWDGTKEGVAAYCVYPNDPGSLTRIHTYQPTVGNYFAQFGTPDRSAADTVRRDYTKEAVFHLTASGGNNSYLLTASEDVASNPSLLAGGTANNLIVYHTSDLGTSWTANTIPFISSAYGIGGVKGTGYAIDAKGDEVAVVVQCMTARPDNGLATYLFRSSNKGLPGTWSSRLIMKRTSADTSFRVGSNFVLASDGSFSVLIDNNGKSHVTAHAGYQTLDSLGGATSTFYMNGAFSSAIPSQLYYWNSDMPDNSGFRELTGIVDINRDGTIDIPAYSATNGAGPYPQAGISMSTIATDANNNLYITYSGCVEGTQATSNPNVTRDVYIMASYNGGTTWTNPINVAGRLVINNCFTADDGSSGSGLYEEAYPITNRRIGADGKLHMQFVSDDLAGLARGGTNSIAAINGWTNWRGNLISYKGISINDIEGSYLKATFPAQVCAGASLAMPVASPVNRLCIYGPVDASSVFRAELDTTGNSAFANPVLLGTFTGSAAGGTITANFPAGWQGNGHIRIVINNADPNANPQLYQSTTGEYPITVTIGAPTSPTNLTNITSSGGNVTAGGAVCGINSVNFNVNSVANANLYEWSLTPAAAGSIQINGDPSIGGTTSLASFNSSYTGPVTVGVKAINGCGTSTETTFGFNVGGGSVSFDPNNANTLVSTVGGGQWEFSGSIIGPFQPLSPAVTQTSLSLTSPVQADGFYRYNNGTCPSNVVSYVLVGLSNAQLANAISIYPNPARESFQVAATALDGRANITVFNGVGQLVKEASLDLAGSISGNTTISTDGMGKGIYFVRVSTGKASTIKRVVIQ